MISVWHLFNHYKSIIGCNYYEKETNHKFQQQKLIYSEFAEAEIVTRVLLCFVINNWSQGVLCINYIMTIGSAIQPVPASFRLRVFIVIHLQLYLCWLLTKNLILLWSFALMSVETVLFGNCGHFTSFVYFISMEVINDPREKCIQ